MILKSVIITVSLFGFSVFCTDSILKWGSVKQPIDTISLSPPFVYYKNNNIAYQHCDTEQSVNEKGCYKHIPSSKHPPTQLLTANYYLPSTNFRISSSPYAAEVMRRSSLPSSKRITTGMVMQSYSWAMVRHRSISTLMKR